jgi:hypothetical protein
VSVAKNGMWSKRDEIDYSLDRRNTLQALFRGSASAMDACDADPYLKRAAKHHGDATTRPCPICRRGEIRELRYVFGDQLGQYSGRIKSVKELTEMQSEYGEFRVYTVEVCLDCDWNHLIYSYLLGDGRTRKPPRKAHTLEDDDFKPDRKVKSWHVHEQVLREQGRSR